MTELKPCPFCGGEAKESSPESNGSKYWQTTCQSCYARIGGTHRGMNREAWNTRAERTCTAVLAKSDYASTCSECGAMLANWAMQYCPNCGAKVVD